MGRDYVGIYFRTLTYAIGLLGSGLIIGMSMFSPKQVYEIDFNNDGKKDIVVKRRNGINQVFLRNEDGSFQFMEISSKEERDLEKRIKELKSNIF